MKLSFTDKIPFIVDKHKNDGDEGQIKINEEILHKKKQAFDKYGNKDKVGMLISMDARNPLEYRF